MRLAASPSRVATEGGKRRMRGRQKRRRRPLLSQGRRDTMVVRQFVHRASALRPSALIRGAPVRRHLAKLSLERLGSAFAQLWDITSHFHASARLRPRSCPVSSPLEGPCGFGSRLGVRPALRGRGLTSGARLLPCLQRPSNRAYQWGHPVARPATVSSLNTIRMPEMATA